MNSETIGQKILDFIREHLLDNVLDDDPLDDPDAPSNFPPANATEQLGTFVKREIIDSGMPAILKDQCEQCEQAGDEIEEERETLRAEIKLKDKRISDLKKSVDIHHKEMTLRGEQILELQAAIELQRKTLSRIYEELFPIPGIISHMAVIAKRSK